MNIVIVGGGTAGWLAAYIIAKSQPNKHKIIVIESSKIGVIGAGEGSTGRFYDILMGKYFDPGTTLEDFAANTDCTRKMGIRHVNWKGDGTSYFAPVDGSPTQTMSPDIIFNYVLSKFGSEKIHLASYIGQSYEIERMPPYGGALHFDGNKVGKYLKSLVIGDFVSCIDSIVKKVNINSSGNITSVEIEDGSEVEGDFFIDCTGFGRVLMKELGYKWKHYKKHLPVDRALPFLLDYEEGVNYEPVTTAHALDHGWMWNVPLQSRRGAGYVFSSEHTDETKAQEEVEKVLGREIKPIKLIKFDSGRAEELWKNNCLSLGLAGAFSEPLEATSIHGTTLQLLVFCYDYLTQTVEKTNTEINRKFYNKKMGKLYDDYCDFLVMHYKGGRSDTDFWKYMKSEESSTEFVKDILSLCQHTIPSSLNYEEYIGASAPLWNWSLAGLNLINPDQARETLIALDMYDKAEEAYKEFSSQFLF